MNRFMIILVAIGAVMANGHLANAQEKSLLGLLKQMPAGTNAVLAADLAQVRSSDIAKKNGWFNTTKGGIESGIDFLPDNCDQIVLASQMDFQTFQSAWTSGLLVVSPMPDLEYIRGMTQGTRDELSGQKLIVTSSDVYVFQAGQNLGTYIPANRQQLAAWLMGMKQGSQSQVSPYLASAIEQRGEATMVLSFDLNQLVSPAAILQRAQDAEILKSNQIDAQKFAQAVASVRGVTVSASFLDAIYADAKVDFGQDVGFLEPVAKQLILEVMQNHGVHLQNAADWQLHMGNDSIQLSGELSQNGLRRLISLFNTAEPQLTATPPANATPQSDAAPAADAESMAQRTKDYFDSVSSLFNELQKEIGPGGKSSYQLARWFKSYADKIDNLPMGNVDPDMLDFGASVSKTFRDMNMKITSTRQSVDVQNSDLMAYGQGSPAYRYRRVGYGYAGYGYGYAYPWGGYYGGYYGGWNRDVSGARLALNQQVYQDKVDIHTRARADATDFVVAAMTNIADGMSDIKRSMTERYPGAFQ